MKKINLKFLDLVKEKDYAKMAWLGIFFGLLLSGSILGIVILILGLYYGFKSLQLKHRKGELNKKKVFWVSLLIIIVIILVLATQG